MSTPGRHPVHQYPVVRQYMTVCPHTISARQTLTTARRMMTEHQVRHLPVLEGGRIIGLLSERDLLLVESLAGVNPTEVLVEEAMVQSVFTAAPDEPVAQVVEAMIERKLGSTVVVEGEHVVGVFTTIDALRALLNLLESR